MKPAIQHWHDIIWFWERINQLLRETERYQAMIDNVLHEERTNSSHEESVCFQFDVPPPMQAIRWEIYHFEIEEQKLFGKKGEEYVQQRWELQFRRMILLKIYGWLLREQCEKSPGLWEEMEAKKIRKFIDDNWVMKFIRIS